MSTGSSTFPIPGSAAFVRLMQVLTRYVSVGVAMSLVNKSLVELGMTPESMSNIDLPEVIEQTMAGLRAFCPEHQLNEMILDLSSLSAVRRQSTVVPRPGAPTASARPSSFPPAMDRNAATLPAMPAIKTRLPR